MFSFKTTSAPLEKQAGERSPSNQCPVLHAGRTSASCCEYEAVATMLSKARHGMHLACQPKKQASAVLYCA